MSALALQLIAEEKEQKTGRLDLGRCGLTELPKELFALNWLTCLNLGEWFWDDEGKKFVHTANSGNLNRLRDLAAPVPSLKNLKFLGLSNNALTEVSFLESLTGLTTLDLSNNALTDVSFLESLTGLTTLDLSNNALTEVSFLESLTGLTTLDLSNNALSEVSFLESLTGLTTLNLDGNQLRDVSSLESLTGLTVLGLSNNALTDVSFLESLTGLRALYLGDNQLRDVSFLASLTGLTTLDLSYNKLRDVSFLESLTGLTTLDLRQNKVSDLTPLIPLLKRGMEIQLHELVYDTGVYLRGNPLTNPPMEVVKQGREAVLDYFEQLESGEDYLHEAKLLIVGEERAGKSTLVDLLSNPDFQFQANRKSTEGIQVQEWNLEKEAVGTTRDFRFNIWDFGGQEIYHATHQFFLTKRSLYLFLTEARKDLRYDDFYYWLNIIQTQAGDSPVLVVQNKMDQDHREFSLEEYRKDFPSIVAPLQRVSCNTKHKKYDTHYRPYLEALRAEILDVLREGKLEGIGEPLPKAWVNIRKELHVLRKEGKIALTLGEYFALCDGFGIAEDAADRLLSIFHELGVLLYFRGDLTLENTVFIHHEWVTQALYRVFDDEAVQDQKGRFTEEDLRRIWKEKKYKTQAGVLKSLLIHSQFKICYYHAVEQVYLAPQLFDDTPKGIRWEPSGNVIRLRIQYTFMPKGILSQLIVLLHEMIENDTFWLHGVQFVMPGATAVVKENRIQSRDQLEVMIYGPSKQVLLHKITDKLGQIHGTYTHLKLVEYLGCVCEECKTLEAPFFFSATVLDRAMQKNQSEIQCQMSFEMVSIAGLLGNYQADEYSVPVKMAEMGRESLYQSVTELLWHSRATWGSLGRMQGKLDGISAELAKHQGLLRQMAANQPHLQEIEAITEALLSEQQAEVSQHILQEIRHMWGDWDDEMKDKLRPIYEQLNGALGSDVKVELAVPLLNLMGVSIKREWNLSQWAEEAFGWVKAWRASRNG